MNRLDDLYDAAHIRIGSHAFITSGNATYEDIYHIINRLRESENDAARYRWLRDEVDRPYCGVLFIDGLVGGDYIDCFIDGKMKEKCDE